MSAPKCLVYLKLARTEWLPSLSTKRTQPGTTSWPLLAVCVRPRLLQAVPSCPCCCLHHPPALAPPAGAVRGAARSRPPRSATSRGSQVSRNPSSELSKAGLRSNSLYLNTWPSPSAGPHAPRQVGGGNQGHEKKTSTRFRKGGSGKSQAGLGREDAAVMITGPFYAT